MASLQCSQDFVNALDALDGTLRGKSVCWCVGVLVCWCVGVLVCWCVGVLVCWCVGVLVCWCVGVLVCWCVGVLVCWCVGVLVCWCVGVLVCWCVGVLVCWCVGVLVCAQRCIVEHVCGKANLESFQPGVFLSRFESWHLKSMTLKKTGSEPPTKLQ